MKTNPESELEKFNTVLRKIMSVSREELNRREKEWECKRELKRRAKTAPAFRASNGKD